MIAAATAHHAQALAAIHAAAFPIREWWDAKAMLEILAMPGAFGAIDERGGLALARRAAGEAELLTLAVAPLARRSGIASALLQHVIAAVEDDVLFVEVADGNTAALALYAGAGLRPCGRRRDYYGPGRDAVLLRR